MAVHRFLTTPLAFALAIVVLALPAAMASAQQAPAAVGDQKFADHDFAGALEAYKQHLTQYPPDKYASSAMIARHAAWAAAMLDNERETLRMLATAIKHGWRDADALITDPHFVKLRRNQRFAALINSILRGQHLQLDQLDIERFLGEAGPDPGPGPGPDPGPGPQPSAGQYLLSPSYADGAVIRTTVTSDVTLHIDFQGRRGQQSMGDLQDTVDTVLGVDETGRVARRDRVLLRMRREVRGGRPQSMRSTFELQHVTCELDSQDRWHATGDADIPAQERLAFEELDTTSLYYPARPMKIGDSWDIPKDALAISLVPAAPKTVLEARCTLTLAEVGTFNGVKNCARVTIDMSSTVAEGGGAQLLVRNLKGDLFVDLDTRRPVRMALEGTMEVHVAISPQQKVKAAEGPLKQTVVYTYSTTADAANAAVGGTLGMDVVGGMGGVSVVKVEAGGPADKAGVREGDVIRRAGTVDVREEWQLLEPLRDLRVGDQLDLMLDRAGRTINVTLTIGSADGSAVVPQTPPDRVNPPVTDPELPEAERALGNVSLGMRAQANDSPVGMRCVEVTPGGLAEAAGLKADDVITRFNGRPVTDGDSLRAALARSRVNSTVKMIVMRAGQMLILDIKLTHK
ncbi:MAG: PDZ domain-containing protein [Planctomycetota bacterium]